MQKSIPDFIANPQPIQQEQEALKWQDILREEPLEGDHWNSASFSDDIDEFSDPESDPADEAGPVLESGMQATDADDVCRHTI